MKDFGGRRVRVAFLVGLASGLVVSLAVVATFYFAGFDRQRAVASASPRASASAGATPTQSAPPAACTIASSPPPSASPSTATSPPARAFAATAYDADRHKMMLFGGLGNGFLNDTWEWNGTSWTQLFPAHAPAARQSAGFVWDSARHVMLPFGGLAEGGVALDDTWKWDGIDWVPLRTAHCPTPRAPSAIAFDEGAAKVVVFGVRATTGNVADTWLWDGADWSQLAAPEPAANVSNSATIGMAWDPAVKSVTLVDFRGPGGPGVNYWRLGIRGWGQVSSVRIGAWGDSNLAVFDPGRGLWLFYGDQNGAAVYASTVFYGVILVCGSPQVHPTAEGSSMDATYDPDLKQTITFGGSSPK